jgi:predicted enzyme related to lactoylglutathione lyase
MPIEATFAHTNLTARDWRSLARFYSEVFGCVPRLPERDLSGPWLDALTGLSAAHLAGVHLELPGYGAGGPTLEIFGYDRLEGGQPPVVNRPGYGHIAFAVEDVGAALEAVLLGGGHTVGRLVKTTIPGAGELTVVYATDPEGNIVELMSWK